MQSATTTYAGLPAQTISYAYHPDGKRQSMTTPAGTFTYGYDAAGRVTSLTNPSAETSGWTYLDNNWPLTQQLGNGATTTYGYCRATSLTRTAARRARRPPAIRSATRRGGATTPTRRRGCNCSRTGTVIRMPEDS